MARVAVLAALAAAVAAAPAAAYVGPGAGFALVSSFLVIFVTLILALLSVLIWPLRTLWRLLRRKRRGKPSIKRLIVVGLDGQDPRLTDRFMAEGKLPNFQKLAEAGLLLAAAHHLSRRSRRSPGRPSPPAPTRPSTTSSTSSTATCGPICRSSRRPTSDRWTASSRSASTGSRWASPSCGCCASRSRSGRFSASRTSGARSCGCRSPSRPTTSTAPSWPRCASPTCSAPRAPSCSSPPGRRARSSRRAACGCPARNGRNGNGRYEATLEGPENLFLEDSPALTLPLVLDLGANGDRASVTIGKESVELEPGKLTGLGDARRSAPRPGSR